MTHSLYYHSSLDDCAPCTEAKNNCKCHCHSTPGDHKSGSAGDSKQGSKGDEQKTPLLKPAPAVAAHRQPSLDDSGVVGDHDGGDTNSIVQQPTSQDQAITKVTGRWTHWGGVVYERKR